jgi:hypothetical protein
MRGFNCRESLKEPIFHQAIHSHEKRKVNSAKTGAIILPSDLPNLFPITIQNLSSSNTQMELTTTVFHIFISIMNQWMDSLKYFTSSESTSCANDNNTKR